jgi:DNA (cytosine-5)-methyltransferase 1
MTIGNNLNFIDLFAGAGGLSLGLEQSGFKPLFVNELNEDAMETYLMNRRLKYDYLDEKDFHEYDIKKILENGYLDNLIGKIKSIHGVDCRKGELDLIVGGPPCQGFSNIGHRRSYAVSRDRLPSNFLFQDMIHIIDKLQPKIFLFENVRGLKNTYLTKNSKMNAYNQIFQEFNDLENYHVETDMIYGKDYGAPQNRPRIFIIGMRKDLNIESKQISNLKANGFLPDPTNNYPHLKELLDDLIDVNYKNGGETIRYPTPALSKYQKLMRIDPKSGVTFRKGGILTEHKYTNHSPKIIKKFEYMIKHSGSIKDSEKTKKFAQRLLPVKWDKEGPNITITSLPDDFVHYKQARILTVREWARLQMFPDWYQFSGKRTTGGIRRAGNPTKNIFFRELPKYTQIGNAVPICVAENIGNHFSKILVS